MLIGEQPQLSGTPPPRMEENPVSAMNNYVRHTWPEKPQPVVEQVLGGDVEEED